MAKWKPGFQQHEFAQHMERIRKEGSRKDLFHHLEETAVLAGMLELNSSIPDLEKARILGRATSDSRKAPITAQTLLRHISVHESAYLRQSIKKFSVITGISVHTSLSVPACVFESSRISFGRRLSVRARQSREEILKKAGPTCTGGLPDNYQTVSISVTARSFNEAIERALDDFDVLRSIWNFSINRSQRWRFSGRTPVNKLLLHPIHTVHESSGESATETWWFDPSYVGPSQGIWEPDQLARCLSFEKLVRRRLRNHPYSNDLKNAIRRYGRSLDSRDFNDAFLRLWAAIELLTDSGSPTNYALTASRAAFLFAERDYSLIALTHLSKQRNRLVHSGVDVTEAEQHLFLLKRYVETLLAFHLGNKFGFASLKEAAGFLDLPSSKRTIDERIRRLKQAKAYVVSP